MKSPGHRPTVLGLLLLGSLALAPGRAPAAEEIDIDTVSSGGLQAGSFQILDDQLRRLIDTALAENPGLQSAWTLSRASLERVDQERALPDPQLTYRYFVLPPETRVGPQEHALELSQAFPWAGKRRLQAERAESLAAGRTWEAEDAGRRLVADIKRTYYEAGYLQEALQVNDEEQELLRRFESIALKRYATGQGIQQVVVKVQTEISRLEDRRTDLERRLRVVCRTLSRQIGQPESPLVLAPIVLPLPGPPPDGGALESRALSVHPGVRALEQRLAGDRAWSRRRRLESRPDLRFGIGYTFVHDREDPAGRALPPDGNGDDILGLSVGINIPLHRSRIHAGIAEAEESEQARAEDLAAVRDRLRQDIQQAIIEIDSLGERGRLYGEVIIPQAGESLASAEAAYTTDRLGFLDLLDAERVLFQSRLAYHRLVTDLWIAYADLELAAAEPLPAAREADRSSLQTTGSEP